MSRCDAEEIAEGIASKDPDKIADLLSSDSGYEGGVLEDLRAEVSKLRYIVAELLCLIPFEDANNMVYRARYK